MAEKRKKRNYQYDQVLEKSQQFKKTRTTQRKPDEELRNYQSKLVDIVSDAIISTDNMYCIKSWNKAAEKIYGWKLEEVLDKNAHELLNTQFVNPIREIAFELLATNEVVEGEVIQQDRYGQKLHIQAQVSLLKNDRGETSGILGVMRNVTEQRKAEEQLRQSEQRLDLALQAGDLVPWEIDLTTMEVIETPRLRKLFGINHNKIMKWEDWGLLVVPEDREAIVKAIREAQGSKDYRLDYRIQKPDGDIHWLTTKGKVKKDLQGKATRLTGIVSDITELKQAQEALLKAKDELEIKVKERTRELAESEEKYRKLVENANEIIVVSQDGLIKFINNKGLEITGYSEMELLLKPFTDFIHPGDKAMMIENYKKRSQGKPVPNSYEFRIVRKDGSTRWVGINTADIQWQGKATTLGLISDITERKYMEQDLKAYAQKITRVQEEERKRIAYELHDDTAQYLSILKMQIGALANSEEIQSPKVKEKLHFLEKDANRAFNDVRRYSHELRPTTLEHQGLVAALEQIADDFNKLGQFSVEVQVEGMEPELSEEVKLGFFRIAQESLNNCRKHAKASQAKIDIHFNHKRIRMKVSNNGEGFNVKEAWKKSSDKGSLGLMSMRERADLIGAKLKIESEPGQGTIVIVAMTV